MRLCYFIHNIHTYKYDGNKPAPFIRRKTRDNFVLYDYFTTWSGNHGTNWTEIVFFLWSEKFDVTAEIFVYNLIILLYNTMYVCMYVMVIYYYTSILCVFYNNNIILYIVEMYTMRKT